MNTPEVNAQSKPSTVYQEPRKFKEEWEMRAATLTAKVNMWLHEHLAIKTPAKLLGGLALGALVMAVTVLPSGVTYGDELSRPFSSEQTQCYPEDVVLGWCYGFADAPDPAFIAGSPSSIDLNEVWTEIEYSDQQSAIFRSSAPSSSARTNYIEDLEVEGMLLDVPHARFASQHSYMAAGCYPEADIQACTADQL